VLVAAVLSNVHSRTTPTPYKMCKMLQFDVRCRQLRIKRQLTELKPGDSIFGAGYNYSTENVLQT